MDVVTAELCSAPWRLMIRLIGERHVNGGGAAAATGGEAERAYRRGEAPAKRRELMDP